MHHYLHAKARIGWNHVWSKFSRFWLEEKGMLLQQAVGLLC